MITDDASSLSQHGWHQLIRPSKNHFTDVHSHHKPGGTWVAVYPRPFQDPHYINLWKNSLYFLLLIICWSVISELKLVNWYVGILVHRQGLSQCSLSHVSGTVFMCLVVCDADWEYARHMQFARPGSIEPQVSLQCKKFIIRETLHSQTGWCPDTLQYTKLHVISCFREDIDI